MKILFLSHYFPPEVNAPATRTFEHCKRWAVAGHSVTVITCNPNAPTGRLFEGYQNSLCRTEVVEGIQVVRLWSYLASNKGFALRILNFLSSMVMMILYLCVKRPKFDRLVATSPQFFTGWAGVIIKWLFRKPFILEIRDIWPESIVTVGAMKKTFLISLLEKLEIAMYRSADHIITVGNGYRDNIIAKGILCDKISVCTNGVDLDQFDLSASGEDIRKEYGVEDIFICSYIGTIGMAHGLEVILDAAKRLKKSNNNQIEFWIVGDGARKEFLEAQAVNFGLESVRFFGRLPKEKIPEIIAASDASLVHLKKTDLFSTVIPSKIFEFMAMETPIIMGVEGESRDIVVRAGAGEVMEPENAEDLILAIETIRSKGRNAYHGRSYVGTNYNRDNLAQGMLEKLLNVKECTE